MFMLHAQFDYRDVKYDAVNLYFIQLIKSFNLFSSFITGPFIQN